MSESFNVHAIQPVLLTLLILMVVVAGLARRFNISYPIVLVLTGLIGGFFPHSPRLPLAPDFVFFVFLPPLLFAAAWQTSWRDFRRNLVSISMLATGLVAFTVFIAAVFAHRFIPELDWRAGLLLGAVASPTDAIAATSIARRLRLPRRVVDILEGESLLNDATGLLALELGLDIIQHGTTPTAGSVSLRLLWLVGAGIGVGLLVGKLASWFEQWINDAPVEIVISFIIPYATYLAAESVHASGVIAVVACGLLMGRRSAVFFSPETRLNAFSTWDVMTFLLNGLVFILLGLQLPYVLAGIRGYSLMTMVRYGLVFSLLLIVVRMVWVFLFAPVSTWIRGRYMHHDIPYPSVKQKFIVGWTGMRGVVALAAAVSLPYTLNDGTPFPARNIIVFLTFIVILVTLVVQGLTLPPLIRSLGMMDSDGPDCEEGEARQILLTSAVAYLREERKDKSHEIEHIVDDLLHQYEHRLEALTECGEPSQENSHAQMRSIALSTVQVEREELINLRDSGRISDETLRKLERELDLSASKLAPDTPLSAAVHA